jgi:transposase-like protein
MWTYLYRAVDQNGKTVDFFLSKRRDVRAAKTLFRHALRKHGDPLSITLDAYAASHRAVQELKDSGEIFYQKMRVRSCAHLNNVVEQRPSTREKSSATDARLQVVRQCTSCDRQHRVRAEDHQAAI